MFQSHSARDRGVRFRCCQLINKLLTNLGEDAQIDDELYDRLYECMLERLKDKCPMVRYHAVLAMARLQDPSDENCPVIKGNTYTWVKCKFQENKANIGNQVKAITVLKTRKYFLLIYYVN